jgi:signal transduction histidine kinase
VIKEALNNILKHAEAEEVHLKIAIQGNDLDISIKDNGKGFCDQDISRFGNGLKNMKKRMADIGGSFDLHSRRGEGTDIRIKVSLET